jgi:hypothetical protein
MTVGTVNNWADLGVTGRVDVDELTVGGSPVTASNGTVTTVSVTTANGVSGSVATATSTPAITLTLGAITPTSVAASGAVSGSNLSGTNTGDQTNITGTARGITTGGVPASASATGVAGTVAWESGFLYVCVATDTWERVAIATWA